MGGMAPNGGQTERESVERIGSTMGKHAEAWGHDGRVTTTLGNVTMDIKRSCNSENYKCFFPKPLTQGISPTHSPNQGIHKP